MSICFQQWIHVVAAVRLLGILAAVFTGANACGATPIQPDGHVQGRIDAPGEVDSYTFEGVAGKLVWIRVGDTDSADDMQPTISVTDPGGVVVRPTNSQNYVVLKLASTGTYRVDVRDSGSNSNGTGPYDLSIAQAPGRPEHGALPVNRTVAGVITRGDLDTYAFYGRAGDLIWLRLGDPDDRDDLVPVMKVIDPSGTQVHSSPFEFDVAFRAPQSGTYTVMVGDGGSNSNGAGPYELNLARGSGPSEAGDLINGGARAGYLRQGDLDSFSFRANGGERIQLSVHDANASDQMVPSMRLLDPNGASMGLSDVLSSASFLATMTGTYKVIVGDFGSNRNHAGPYSVNYSNTGDYLSYAALGDSYAAGEGVRPFIDKSDTPSEGCHRSTKAHPTKVRVPGSGTPLSQRNDSSFDFFACTGAVSDNVRAEGSGQYGEAAQMAPGNQVNASRDLVTITIGGNDAQFAPIFKLCFLYSECHLLRPFGPHSDLTLGDFAPLLLAYTSAKLVPLHQEVRLATPNAATIVVGYPILFSGRECSSLQFPPTGESNVKVSATEQLFLRELNSQINQVVKTSAALAGLHFVSVEERFRGHEICGEGGAWINGLVFFNADPNGDPVVTLNYKASAHPTARGQQEYANAVNEYLAGIATGWAHGYLPNGLPKNPPPVAVLPAPARQSAVPSSTVPSMGDLSVGLAAAPVGCANAGNIVVPSEGAILRGVGFEPGEHVDLTAVIGGQARTLGSALADASGNLDITVTMPTDLPVDTVVGVQALGAGPVRAGRLLVSLVRVVSSSRVDNDGDGVVDICDNCTRVANVDQRDTDGDGYGNICDADLDNNGIVNTLDLALFRAAFGQQEHDLDADLDGNFVVNTLDLAIFKNLFGKAPGPAYAAPLR